MKSRYLLGLLGVLASVPAVAQTENPNSDNGIVVTAERTNRSLRQTSSSVAVDTADEIAARAGDASTADLLERIPNVVVSRSSNYAPAVRGIDGTGPAIGGNAFFAGTRSRLNYLVDGRTLTFNEATYIDGSVWDIQQLEVYRGPQSLLQGRNSIAGVIAIKTADPTFDWHGKARIAIGEDDFRQYGVALGGPLIGQSLAFRLAGEFQRENTFIKVDPALAVFDNRKRSQSKMVRGKLLFTPEGMPSVRSLLTLSYTDDFAPQTTGVQQPFEELKYSSNSVFPRFRTRSSVAISDTSWQVTDGIALSAFLTASDFRINRYVQPTQGIAEINGVEYTAEPRIRFGTADSHLSGFLAGYLFRTHQHEFIDFLGDRNFRDRTETDAVFGELTWKPSSLVELTGGARYEEERRDRVGGAAPFSIDYHQTFRAFLPRTTLTWHPDGDLSVGATVARGYNSGGAGFAFNPPFPTFTYGKETVWDYEVFVRSELAGGRLRLNANIFYNDYDGLQLPFDIANNPSAPALVIRNADRATTYGAEAEVKFAPIEPLDLNASVGLLKTRINRYSDPNIQGNDLPRSPAFSLSVGAVGRPFAGIEASVDVRYTDTYYSEVFNNARGKTDPYFVANARLSYTVGPARLFIGATNLFNTFQPVYYVPGTNPAQDIAYLLPPRRVIGGIDLGF